TVITADDDGVPTPLSEDREYRAAVAIEYPDGSVGVPMAWPDRDRKSVASLTSQQTKGQLFPV
ncbi:MAG: hypothetical protein VB817_08525, partial [Pirellulaceae bacterium]